MKAIEAGTLGGSCLVLVLQSRSIGFWQRWPPGITKFTDPWRINK